MLYAILCYDSEEVVGAWSAETETAVMARLGAVQDRLRAEGRLGPVARLMPTTAATTVRKGAEPLVLDGPFAETKEQLLGFYVVDCDSLDAAIEVAAEHLRGRVVTFVPQDPFASFNPLFRIGTQIRDLMRFKAPRDGMGSFGRSRKADEASAIAMLDAVQLPQPKAILDKYPHQLSGGQRQRVMIAMALLPQPRMIIADEPTTALDVTVQAQILGLLRRLAVERGVSVLFTTHDLGAAWEICDRVVVMYAGQTAEIAPREQFFGDPRHPYTRMLLDSLPTPGRDPIGIPGGVPSPLKAPNGCRFNPRCPRATDVCHERRPALIAEPNGHVVACHHPWPAEAEAVHV